MKPLASIDIESTGVDPAIDRIVELAIVTEGRKPAAFYCNPGVTMSPEVIECHGITNEKAATFRPFKEQAKLIMDQLLGCDLVGFNLLNFDVPLLWEELFRAGINWDLSTTQIIDVVNIFKKKEERTLSAAVKFYLLRDHAHAHSAIADATATAEVLSAQIEHYPELGLFQRDALSAFSRFDDRVDLAGKIVRNKDGVPCYNIGKAKGIPVIDDVGFGSWMLRNNFTAQTKAVITELLEIK